MKKFAVLFLSVIMVFSLAACGAATPAAPESAAPESPVPAPEETPTAEQAYAVVIGEYYTALEQRWNGAELMENGLKVLGNEELKKLQ